MTKRTNKLALYGLAVFLVLGFNAACSKQLLPPDVESGGSQTSSSFDSGSGSGNDGGFSDSNVGGEDGSTGTVADGGDAGEGFNITAENETGSRPNDGFTDSNVGDGSGSMGSGNHGDMNFGSDDQGFGSADKFNHDTDSNGAFGFGGGSGDSGSGSADGSGGTAGGSGGQFGSDGSGSTGMAGSGGRMGGHEEARLLTFKPSDDLKDVHFEFDKYDLDDNTKEVLKANAEWLKQNPGARVEIQGHCDERGTNNYNLGLGERRAISTKKYLMALGVDETRLFTISYGEEKPFCFESSENCWLENRRAHFMVAQ